MEKLKGKAEIIIIAVVAVVVIAAIIIYNVVNKKEEFVYGITQASSSPSSTMVIEDTKTLKSFIKKSGLNDEITINYKKYSIQERYTDEFFNTKKLALVMVNEDTSKEYIHDIDDVIYNKERTDVTIKYVYKSDGYAGNLSKSWVTCMIVELDNTVNNVNFVLDNSSAEKDKK